MNHFSGEFWGGVVSKLRGTVSLSTGSGSGASLKGVLPSLSTASGFAPLK